MSPKSDPVPQSLPGHTPTCPELCLPGSPGRGFWGYSNLLLELLRFLPQLLHLPHGAQIEGQFWLLPGTWNRCWGVPIGPCFCPLHPSPLLRSDGGASPPPGLGPVHQSLTCLSPPCGPPIPEGRASQLPLTWAVAGLLPGFRFPGAS